jgi:hypothetical protein
VREGIYKYFNEFKENTNKQLNKFKGDKNKEDNARYKREIQKSYKNSKEIQLKFYK